MHGLLGLPIKYFTKNDRNSDFGLSETLYLSFWVYLLAHKTENIRNEIILCRNFEEVGHRTTANFKQLRIEDFSVKSVKGFLYFLNCNFCILVLQSCRDMNGSLLKQTSPYLFTLFCYYYYYYSNYFASII